MKLLESQIKKNGFTYNIVERTQNKAIYSQNKKSKILAYEVFRIKRRKASSTKFDGKFVYFEARESFPSNEDFGKTAWSYPSLAEAKKKYHAIPEYPLKKGF